MIAKIACLAGLLLPASIQARYTEEIQQGDGQGDSLFLGLLILAAIAYFYIKSEARRGNEGQAIGVVAVISLAMILIPGIAPILGGIAGLVFALGYFSKYL